MANVTYVPSRVGEGYFTDWQNPLPTSDPGVAGQIWVDSEGYLRVSLGEQPLALDFSSAQNSMYVTLF